jgi:mono/diheme cytochrome c family protein
MRKKWILQWALVAGTSLWFAFEADAQNSSGEQDFAKLCLGCHGEGATGTDRGPALINSRSLRNRSEKQIQQIIRSGTEGGMPTFPLPQEQLQPLARWVHSLNASASDLKLAGNVTAGEQFFFGKGQCGTCHMVSARGKSNGSDLSDIGRQLTLKDLEQALDDPSSRAGNHSSVS